MTGANEDMSGATGGDGRAYKEARGERQEAAEIIRGVRAGNGERFDELVIRYEKPLYNFVLGHRVEAEAAADITQDAFLRAFRALDTFDETRSSFKTWLYTIAFNLVRDRGRRAKVRKREIRRMAQHMESAPGDPGPEAAVAARDEAERLLSKLEDEAREILTMKFLHDLTYKDISKVTGLGEATIRSKVHRALKRLKATAPGGDP